MRRFKGSVASVGKTNESGRYLGVRLGGVAGGSLNCWVWK